MKTLYHLFIVLFTMSLLLILVVFTEAGWTRFEKLLAVAFSVTTLIGIVIARYEWKREEEY